VMVDEPASWTHAVIGVNDTLTDVSGQWSASRADGTQIADPKPFTIPANGTSVLGEIPYDSADHRLMLIEWTLDHDPGLAHRNHYLAAAPPVSLRTYLDHWLPAIAGSTSAPPPDQAGTWGPSWLSKVSGPS